MMPLWHADALLRDQDCESAKVSSLDDNVQINLPIRSTLARQMIYAEIS